MRVNQNENYDVIFNATDVDELLKRGKVSFFIIHNDENLSFDIKRE